MLVAVEMEDRAMPTEVHRNEVRRLLDTGAQLVEVLPPQEYEAEHLPGAVNIPLKQMNAATTARLRRDAPAIVYCYDYQ
jgi:phage shock protein E